MIMTVLPTIDYKIEQPIPISFLKVKDLLKGDKSFEKTLKHMEENLAKWGKRKYRVSVT
jgi:hypothetical protein